MAQTANQKTDKPARESAPTQISLGLEWAPLAFNRLSSASVYAIDVGPAARHAGLMSTILSSSLAGDVPCTLMTPLAPEAFLRRCETPREQELMDAVVEGQLCLLTMIGNYRKNIARLGPRRLLRELGQCGVSSHSLLIVDQAEQIFSLHHPETALDQLAAYQEWLQQTQSTLLLLFSRAAEDSELAAGHHAIIERATGSARLEWLQGGTELWIDFWHSPEGVLIERRITLPEPLTAEVHPQGRRLPHRQTQRLSPAYAPGSRSGADDEDDVFYLGNALTPASLGKSRRWIQADSLVGILHATRDARAATVILSIGESTDWLQLAQAVHAMRLQCGPLLRIVVLGNGQPMRYQNEALLLRVGANMVVHDAASMTRLPLLLESIQDQFHGRADDVSFEDAVASATPMRAKGYLPPDRFCEKVRAALARARTLEVPCMLIVLDHVLADDLPGSVGRFHLSRDGDLLTANAGRCYIFLYGCVATDMHALMARLLDSRHAAEFEDPVWIRSEEDILATLDQLDGIQRLHPFQIRALDEVELDGLAALSDPREPYQSLRQLGERPRQLASTGT